MNLKKITLFFAEQPRLTRVLLVFAGGEFFYLLAQYLDGTALAVARKFAHGDFWEMFKFAGYLPLWLLVALGLWAHEKFLLKNIGRGALLFGSATAAMLTAEMLKLLIRRERPQAWLDFLPIYRDWSGSWWASNDLGMPSSHTATAFGAAFALGALFPSARLLWLGIAAMCGFSRLIGQAHSLTDVYIAAIVAWVMFRFVQWVIEKIAPRYSATHPIRAL